MGTSGRQVFVSYCHADVAWLDRLKVHFRPLVRRGTLDLWDDTRIAPGRDWHEEINQALTKARVAVLLVSADFLASDFVADSELPKLLQRVHDDGVLILPIIVGHCLFSSHSELSKYQSVNPPDKPLSGIPLSDADRILVSAARAIDDFFRREEQTARSLPDPAQPPTAETAAPTSDPVGLAAGAKERLSSIRVKSRVVSIFPWIGTVIILLGVAVAVVSFWPADKTSPAMPKPSAIQNAAETIKKSSTIPMAASDEAPSPSSTADDVLPPISLDCSLAVLPYNITSIALHGREADALVNKLPEKVCKERTTYGKPTEEPHVAENPLAVGAEGKNVPRIEHGHTYLNSSNQDNYYYRSFIEKFEITLQADALANTNKDRLQCVTPVPPSYPGDASDLVDCDGHADDLYGGTRISYDKKSGIILWEFGVKDKAQWPQRWGNNPGLNEVLSSIVGSPVNLSDSASIYRRFDPSIYLTTKNNEKLIWSATSTARILIRNYSIIKSSVDNGKSPDWGNFKNYCSQPGDYTKWCPLPSPPGFEEVMLGQQKWFWYPIGSVASVWRK